MTAEPFSYIEAEPAPWQVALAAEVRGLLGCRQYEDDLAHLARKQWPPAIWRRLEHPLEQWQRERADRARGAILHGAPRVWTSTRRQSAACEIGREILLDVENDSELDVVTNLLHELYHFWNGPSETGAREMEKLAPKLLARLRLCRERGHHHEREIEVVR